MSELSPRETTHCKAYAVAFQVRTRTMDSKKKHKGWDQQSHRLKTYRYSADFGSNKTKTSRKYE